MYREYNRNPRGKRVGDCVIRAVSRATGKTWEETYAGICAAGYELCDMPSANQVWGAYLRRQGFRRNMLPDTCPDCYTVEAFCRDHPSGVYVLAISGHVVCAEDGDWYDSWDSGQETPVYYWQKED